MKVQPVVIDETPPRSVALRLTAVLVFTGLLVFFLAFIPNDTWSPEWGNFFGAAAVAIGGLLATLNSLGVQEKETGPWAWASIVVGGFAIAGASLQMALAT